MSDTRILRDRQAIQEDTLDRSQGNGDEANAAYLVTTFSQGSYPTTPNAFYSAHLTNINGTESEGSAASYVDVTGSLIYVWNAGTAVPPQGTTMIASAVGGRLVARYDG